jgi:hypothetical protein
MKRSLLISILLALSGCYPPDNALDYMFHPLKDCNHDVRLDNAGSQTLNLTVRVSDKISDTRCEQGSAEGTVSVAPGQSAAAHTHLRCVDCYVNKSAEIQDLNGQKVHSEYTGAPAVYCDDTGCINE